MTESFGLNDLQNYADAVERFVELRREAQAKEKELDSMLRAVPRCKLMQINEKVDEYSAIVGELAEIDRSLDNLYDCCIRALDLSYRHTAEVRVPRMMMAWVAGKKEEIRRLYP